MPPHQAYTFAHEVWIEKDSLLGDAHARAPERRLVRSEQPPPSGGQGRRQGFRVSATAPDGVIEAIEDPAALFCLGVQWHPENFFRTGEFRPLFEGFLEATKKA